MNMPLEITFLGIPASPALRNAISSHAARLESLAPDAISCRVTVEKENSRRQPGDFYRVHARLMLPGAELDAGRSSPASAGNADPYVAVHDTFHALQRRLEGRAWQYRGDESKRHGDGPRRGRIFELYPDTGYGLIQTDDGCEVQFHRAGLARGNSADLEVGREVRFIQIPSVNGPWAGNVQTSGE